MEIFGFVAFAALVLTWVVLPIRPIKTNEAPVVAFEDAA